MSKRNEFVPVARPGDEYHLTDDPQPDDEVLTTKRVQGIQKRASGEAPQPGVTGA